MADKPIVDPSTGTPFADEFLSVEPNNIALSVDKASNVVASSADSFSDELKNVAMHRVSYIKWVDEHLDGGWTGKNLKPLLDKAAEVLPPPVPNWRTLVRWRKRYIQHGNKLISLIPKHQDKGNTKSRLSPSDEVFFEQAVNSFLVGEQPSIASAYQAYRDAVELENFDVVDNPIKVITYNGFYNRIKKLPAYEVMCRRKGSYRANVEFKAIGSHKRPTRILERVEIDHTPLDLILLDDEHSIPLGRPTLTMLIDAYSHCIVGFYLGFKQPGYEPVRNALLNAISPKDYVRSTYPDIEHDWPCYGKPETLVVDNGVEFWSASLEQACLELGINIQYNPVRKPWLKPQIERFFGTINKKLLDAIPGKTFSNILKRADYNSQKDAVMHFSAFLEILHRWIIDVYHYEADARHRYIPIRLWEAGYQLTPPARIIDADLTMLEVILSITLTCTHRRGGIQRYHLRYDSDELASYRMHYPESLNGKRQVIVKLNPRDISYIYVAIDEVGEYIRVPCVDAEGYTAGLSLQEHLINVKLQKLITDTQVDVVSLSKARDSIRQRINDEFSTVPKSLRKRTINGAHKIARYLDVGSHSDSLPMVEIGSSNRTVAPSEPHNPKEPELDDDWNDFTAGLEPY